jgi:hypothetical protein
MHTTLHCSFSTKACKPAIFFKAILASSKVTFATLLLLPWKSQIVHEEIPNQSNFFDHVLTLEFFHPLLFSKFVKNPVIGPFVA